MMTSATPTFELFARIPEETTAALVAGLPQSRVPAGTFVTREGAVSGRLYLVESGSLAVWKGPPDSVAGVQLARLGPGACLGEIAVLRPAPSSVSVVATTDVCLREVPLDRLAPGTELRQQILLNLARIVAQRLGQSDRALRRTRADQQRKTRLVGASARYLNFNLVGLSLCMFSQPLVAGAGLSFATRTGVTVLLIGFFCVAAALYARQDDAHRALLGLRRPNGWRVLRQGLLWSVPLILLCAVAKPLVVAEFGEVSRVSVMTGEFPAPVVVVLLGLTAAVAIAVEFVRCSIQAALAFFFRAAEIKAEWIAIVVSAMVCAALQIHLGGTFAWLNVALGLLWGSLFAREGSFFAPAVSHAIVACAAMCLLGFPP